MPNGLVTLHRAQLEAMMRLLVDDGHMTPVAVRQIQNVLDAAETNP